MNQSIPRRALFCLPLLGLEPLLGGEDQATPAPRQPAGTLKAATDSALPVDSQGFIRRWRVWEPVPYSGRLIQSEVERALLDAPFPGGPAGSHVLDTVNYNFNLYHFAWALHKPTSNVVFWIETVVNVPADMAVARLAIGSNAASAWWLDDQRLISLYNDRQSVIDDGVSRRIPLRKGLHRIRAAILNGGGATDFCARFIDAADRPINTLRTPAAG